MITICVFSFAAVRSSWKWVIRTLFVCFYLKIYLHWLWLLRKLWEITSYWITSSLLLKLLFFFHLMLVKRFHTYSLCGSESRLVCVKASACKPTDNNNDMRTPALKKVQNLFSLHSRIPENILPHFLTEEECRIFPILHRTWKSLSRPRCRPASSCWGLLGPWSCLLIGNLIIEHQQTWDFGFCDFCWLTFLQTFTLTVRPKKGQSSGTLALNYKLLGWNVDNNSPLLYFAGLGKYCLPFNIPR